MSFLFNLFSRFIEPLKRAFFLLSMVFITSSCSLMLGDDGNPGEVYLAINWVEQPVFYSDTNPAIPADLERNKYYLTKPGRYSFQYAYNDDYGWEGFYELQEAEPGNSGNYFRQQGRDGKSAYYTLILSYRGSTIDNYYEKALPGQHEYIYHETVGGFRITVFAKRIEIDNPFNGNQNKLRAITQ